MQHPEDYVVSGIEESMIVEKVHLCPETIF